ncbi:MAG: alkaline phosphatase D family protein [Planctomycetota bacterium]
MKMTPTARLLAVALLGVQATAWAQDPAAVAHDDTILSRISFGSCAFEDRPQPIWNRVVEEEPQLWIWGGDNIYIDLDARGEAKYAEETATADGFRTRTERKYAKLFAQPEYQDLLAREPFLLATWDDHDFGLNDAGVEFRYKQLAQELFLNAWGVPKDSPRRQREGVYHCETFGPVGQRVQVLVLDTRYHRSALQEFRRTGRGFPGYRPVRDRELTMLGEDQWTWLEARFREPADVRLVVSSIQFVSEEHRFEKWANLPADRQRMVRLIEETGAEGVVFLSGDRHHGELSRMHRDGDYPLYDLTASGLTQSNRRSRFSLPETNRHRVGSVANGHHFGDLDIDWSEPDPLLRMRIVYAWGEVPVEQTIRLSELGRQPVPGIAGIPAEASTTSPTGPVEPSRRVDGSFNDWDVDGPIDVDTSHVYVRFTMPEECTLLSVDQTIRVAVDLDGSNGTGQTVEGIDGADLLFEFNPSVQGRDARKYRYLPRVFTLPAGSERGEIDIEQTGLQFQPTHASRNFELRFAADMRNVATEVRMAQGRSAEVAVTMQRRSGGEKTELCRGEVVVPADELNFDPRAVQSIDKDPESIRVMSWNVLWASPQDDERRAKFSRVFRALQPDIVLIQEWDRTRYSEGELAEWFHENVDSEVEWSTMVTGIQDFGQGTAVVSRHPFAAKGPAHLPVEAGRWDFPMRFASAVIETPQGRVLAGSAHLKASGSLGSDEDQRRLAEVRAANYLIRGMAAASQPDLIVLGGDLNMNGTTEVARLLWRDLDLDRSPLMRAQPSQLGDPALVYTFGNGPSKARFDFLGYSDINADVTKTFVFDTELLSDDALALYGVESLDAHGSDHLPVVLDLRPKSRRER